MWLLGTMRPIQSPSSLENEVIMREIFIQILITFLNDFFINVVRRKLMLVFHELKRHEGITYKCNFSEHTL